MQLFVVDAFTDQPFAGNPAAVCLLERPVETAWMHRVAAEMNLSETAFVRPRGDRFDLRWFTPSVEVELCGHATLASAHVLWKETGRADVRLEFETASGVLTASRASDSISLDFPATPPLAADPPDGLLEALGVEPGFVGRSRFDQFVVVGDEAIVRGARPDFRRLREISMRGVILTSASRDPAFDFVSRYFAPAAGIDEDPVTGSAHCCLGPFWAERSGKHDLIGYQASSRGGIVSVAMRQDRVMLTGDAVTVIRGAVADAALPPAV